MLIACRIGILTLTIGTTADNFRKFFGAFSAYSADSPPNRAVSWYCIFDHEVLCSLTIVIPLQFIYSYYDRGYNSNQTLPSAAHTQEVGAATGESAGEQRNERQKDEERELEEKNRKWWLWFLPRVSVTAVAVLFIIGLAGFVAASARGNTLALQCNCNGGSSSSFHQPVHIMQSTQESPTGLVSVFAYTFAMVGCGIFYACKCRCKYDHQARRTSSSEVENAASSASYTLWKAFFVTNTLCLLGQALLPALGSVYGCYGSNFWEQVAFVTAVLADGHVNERAWT